MKQLNLLLSIAIIGILLASCSSEYEEQRKMILTNVQTVEEGNVLDLKAEIINIDYDTIVTTRDSLDEYMDKWDYEYDDMVKKLTIEYDSVLNIMNEMTKNLNYEAKDLYKLSSELENIEMQIKLYKEAMKFTVPFNPDDPFEFKKDIESRNAIYHIYNCTYKAFNPALNVDQTLTMHFVFNENQTKIIRRY